VEKNINAITTRTGKKYLDELHGMLLNFEQRLIHDNEVVPTKLEDSLSINYGAKFRHSNNPAQRSYNPSYTKQSRPPKLGDNHHSSNLWQKMPQCLNVL